MLQRIDAPALPDVNGIALSALEWSGADRRRQSATLLPCAVVGGPLGSFPNDAPPASDPRGFLSPDAFARLVYRARLVCRGL